MSEQESSSKSEEREQKSDERHGIKRHSDDQPDNVHSANEWESVDLGDEGRKSKFLRLMGASKKEHHGRFIIGDKKPSGHARSIEETQKLNVDLEDQYRQGLEMKMSGGARRHIGLGFANTENSQEQQQLSRSSSEVSTTELAESCPVDLSIPPVPPADSVDEGDKNEHTVGEENNHSQPENRTVKKTALPGFVPGSSS